jgi:glutamate--cysteine ligase
MTAQELTRHDPLADAADPVELARQHVATSALHADVGGRVGLELEYHLVDLAQPARRPTWNDIEALASTLPELPRGSSITFEPGGQIELSTPPGADVGAAVAALRADEARLRALLLAAGFGAAALGADLARAPQRVNPHSRYRAMEEHFDSRGAGSGRQMMTATAALQVNLDAGPQAGWEERLARIRTLVPMLVALSSTSPWLGGTTSGWHSMRQGVWQGIDHGRSDPVGRGDPTSAWATYALDAPVMLVRSQEEATPTFVPVTERIPFAQWLRGAAPFGRPATLADLEYHLTTLFPPVRPRGYVELRCLDALPARWWPAVAAVTATLIDDPQAADAAAELVTPVADSWETAARHGLHDPAVHRAVTGCVEVALRHVPTELVAEVEALAALLEAGSSPSEEIRRRVEAVGPLAVLEEEARG